MYKKHILFDGSIPLYLFNQSNSLGCEPQFYTLRKVNPSSISLKKWTPALETVVMCRKGDRALEIINNPSDLIPALNFTLIIDTSNAYPRQLRRKQEVAQASW